MASHTSGVRNPFGVADVPDPFDRTVMEFAAHARLEGTPADDNAPAWCHAMPAGDDGLIDGEWSSRWNGGADPTIPNDLPELWKQGRAQVKTEGAVVYLRFDWSEGARKGLIEVKRDGQTLVGKYINLTDPTIQRPWIGLIVNGDRIDGRWTGGRLDFRR